MIRQPSEAEVTKMKINVYLKTGEEFIGKDLTEQPLTDKELFVGFWDGDIIKIYPSETVAKIEYTFDT